MLPASRGLAPREGLESLLVKMGRTGPLVEPRRGTQAGKSGDSRSQNADSIPRAQGALGLGFEAKPKGKCGAPRAPDRKSTRLNSSHGEQSRMPSSA